MKEQSTQHRDAAHSAPVPHACFTINEFCQAHRISRSHFYDLTRRGQGPTIMKAGYATLISIEAAAEWRRRMESTIQGAAA